MNTPKAQINPVVDYKSKAYQNQKNKRIKESKQDPKHDFKNPRIGTVFPETHFMDFRVIQDGAEIKLATYRYKQIGFEQPKALLLLFHGLNSSVSHGSHIAKAYAEAGFCVMGFDHRGFGASQGLKGYVENIDIHLQDCRQFVNKIEAIYGKEIKKFVSGLSMGGMSSYNLCLEMPNRFAGVIFFAPAIKHMAAGVLVSMAKLVDFMAPRWNFIKQTGGVCHRSSAMAKYMIEDPCMYFGKMCGSTIKFILTAMDSSNATFEHFNTPFIVIQGGTDKLVDPDVGFELMEKAKTTDKTHIFYEQMWHDVWHEEEIYEIIPTIVEWANKRL